MTQSLPYTIMHLHHACRWKWSFRVTNVYGNIQIVAAALHVKNGVSQTALYLGQLCQPFIQNTDQLRSGHWLIEADGRCGQMSVKYDQVRLAATGI